MAGVPMTPIVRVNETQPRTVELLGEAMKTPYLPRRVQLVTELGLTKLPAAAKFLREAMADPEPQVRAAAAWSAGQVGEPSLVADLKKLLHDSDAHVRIEAVLAGAALGDASFIDAGLADADTSVVVAAVSVAGAGQAGKLVAICNAAPATGDSNAPGNAGKSATAGGAPAIDATALRITAVRALGRIGDSQNSNPVAKFLNDPAVSLRAAAVESIGRMKAAGHSGTVESLLADAHPTVRRSALVAMSLLAKPSPALNDAGPSTQQFQQRCITALADEDLSVRETAARLLQTSPTSDALPALMANLPNELSRLHTAVREAIVAIGPAAVASAEKLLTDSNPRRREDGSYLLGGLKSAASLEAHMALMKDPDWQVVRQAAVSLGQIGRKEAAPAVAAVSHLADQPVLEPLSMEAIEQSIVTSAELGDVSMLPMCKTILPARAKYSGTFRAAGAFLIGRLGDRDDKSLSKMLTHPLSDLEEADTVKFECVKALGQLKLPAAAGVVGKDRASAKYLGDARTDWLDYWVRSRVLGPQPPLTPFPMNWEASTSVYPVR